MYIADENTVPHILAEFRWAGVDIGKATSRGSLSVVTKHDAYLRHGIFDPEKMIADLARRMAGCHCVVVRDGKVVRHHTHASAGVA